MSTHAIVSEPVSVARSAGLAAVPRWARLCLVALLAAAIPVLLKEATSLGLVWYRIFGLGAVYAMAVLSLNLLMGYAGQISLGHMAFLAAGAYAAGLVVTTAGMSFVVGFIVAGVVGAVTALLVGLPALRLRGLLLAVTTLGFLVVMLESILKLDLVRSGSVGAKLPRPVLGALDLSHNAHYLSFLLVLLVAFWAVDGNLMKTRLGRAFQGLREDEQVAASYGIDVARTKLTAFVVSGAMAGIAGAAYGHLFGSVQATDFRLDLSLAMVAWVVIGGLGSRVGVVVSGALFAVFPFVFNQFVNWISDSEFGDINEISLIIGAALFLFTVAINPNGFAGSIREKHDEEAAKAAKAALKAGGVEEDDPTLPSLPVPAARHGDVTPGEPILEVGDITVRFGGLTAVNAADIQVNAGEIVGLIGPNGAGKTTLFDAIGGFNQPATGKVWLRGQDLTDLPPHERALAGLGRTFQRTGLAMALSVRDNLLLAQHALADYDSLQALGHSPKVAMQERELVNRTLDVVEALGFSKFLDLPVKYLSGGQRRIVEIACTLVTAPDLLMLDEPTAGMAPAAVENLADRLRELRDVHGRTILIIEHHVPLVLDVCDRIYVLDHGDVIAEGTPDEILRDPHVLSAYLGERAASQAGLVEEGVPA